MSTNSLADRLPYWHIQDSFMVYKDGSLGAGFKIKGADITSSSNEAINNLGERFEDLLIASDEGLKFQLYYELSPEVAPLILEHKKVSEVASDTYKRISRSRFDRLDHQAQMKGFYHPKLFFFVRSRPHKLSKQKFWQKEAPFKRITLDSFQEHEFSFERQIKTVESSLRQAGFNPIRFNDQDWFEVVFNYLNPGRMERIGLPVFQKGTKAA